LRPSRWAAEYYRKEYTDLETFLDGAGQKLVPLGKLGRLFTGPFGSELPASIYNTPNGIPLLRVQNIGELFLNEEDLARIPEAVHQEIYRSRLEPGDLALAKAGRLGALSKIPAHMPECNITQHIVGVKVAGERVRGSYLAAFFLSRFGSFQLRRQGIGTLIKYLGIEETRAAKVPVPDRRIQDYIGAKVELAERCRTAASESWCAASQRLAGALGCSLDPATFEVKSAASVSAAGYKVVSIHPVVVCVAANRLDRYIGAQFFHPRRAKALLVIEQSGLKVRRLVDLATRFADRITPEEMRQQALLYVGLAQIDSATGFVSKKAEEDPTGTSARFRAGDILFSKLRPYLNKVSICPDHLAEAAGSTELLTYRANDDVDPYYVFFVLKSPLVLNQVIDITSGSTHPRVAPELIDDVVVPLVPPPDRAAIAASARSALVLTHRATSLVEEAKADVEALIDGTLDTNAILSGKLKPPTEREVLGA